MRTSLYTRTLSEQSNYVHGDILKDILTPGDIRNLDTLLKPQNLGEKLDRLAQKIHQLEEGMGGIFANIDDAVDELIGLFDDEKYRPYFEHSRRIAKLSVLVAMEMGFDSEVYVAVAYSSALHDIGKLMWPDRMLKGRKFQRNDQKIKEKHPAFGAYILRRIGLDRYVKGVLFHHEYYNGSGYPYGFDGEHIPIEARIMAVADWFDAMVSPMPYKKEPLSYSKALQMVLGAADGQIVIEAPNGTINVEKEMGAQFDPQVVSAFTGVFKRAGSMVRIYGSNNAAAIKESIIILEYPQKHVPIVP